MANVGSVLSAQLLQPHFGGAPTYDFKRQVYDSAQIQPVHDPDQVHVPESRPVI